MIWRIEVREKPGCYDAVGQSALRDIHELGYRKEIRDIEFVQTYLIDGDLDEEAVLRIASELLTDPVTQEHAIGEARTPKAGYRAIEIAYHAGVMDPVEESASKAILDLGIRGVRSIRTAKRFLLKTTLSPRAIESIAEKTLFNKVIQHIVHGSSTIPPDPPPYTFNLILVPLTGADDGKLERIAKDGQLFLTVDEMRAIQSHFKALGREPTDCELETVAQTWSEHCKHKTFRGRIDYNGTIIENLLKRTIMRATAELAKPWCVSVFKDNSGIIRFDEATNVCFKVETHNHPSALEPYGGAGTGIGGVIRDPLGTGMGAKPIVNTDVFCFARPDFPHAKLPKSILHPKRIMKGVVSGVRDYGNRMGIPTVNGAVLFDDAFLGNPLVFCGNVGILPKEMSFKKTHAGDLIMVVGGRTGRDGIHGATFSSGELTHDSKEVSGHAVQIGNPIQEKKVADTILKCRDLGLYTAITDCGAGGLSSAVGEMGEELGAEVHLDRVPLKYKGLSYTEIWISEAQERMVISVPPENLDRIREVFESENVEATVIGTFTGDHRLRLYYEAKIVADIEMAFLHDGLPDITRKAAWDLPVHPEPAPSKKSDYTSDLLGLLATPTIGSKEWIIRQYDHEVQGGSVLKPLQGRDHDGPGDASVVRPILGSDRAIALSCGINVDFGKIDPYWMAASVIDEALRQIVAVGADYRTAAILDNFCWGNTSKPDRLGQLVRASLGCYDFAIGYGVPFISGKDSLNNEFSVRGKTISIPPTLLISCIAVIDDASKTVTMDAKRAGHPVYLVGMTRPELGGSQYFKLRGFVGNRQPIVDAALGRRIFAALGSAIASGAVAACHDCSDGGLAVACAEMAFAGGLGMRVDLDALRGQASGGCLRDEEILFSESNTRFVVEVSDDRAFARFMRGLPCFRIGTISKSPSFTVGGSHGTAVRTTARELKSAWQKPFRGY